MIAQYAMHVRKAVSRSKPRHVGRRGRVIIGFGIGNDGRLRYADIVTSSGDARMDAAALDAIRRARFPRPPDGMTEKSLTFTVPFGFQ